MTTCGIAPPPPPDCDSACRYSRTLNNQACQGSMRKDLTWDETVAAMTPKDRENAYAALICPAGGKTKSGGCCMVLDDRGVVSGITGRCAQLGTPELQTAIKAVQKQRLALYEREQKAKEQKRNADMEKSCKNPTVNAAPRSGWMGAVKAAGKQNKKVAQCNEFKIQQQSILGWLASSPSVWVAGACIIAGGVVLVVM